MEDKPVYGQCPFCGASLTTSHTMVCQGWKENSIESVEDQLSSAKDRIMDLEEALKEEIETNKQQADLLRQALNFAIIVKNYPLHHEGELVYSIDNINNEAQSLISDIGKALEKVK